MQSCDYCDVEIPLDRELRRRVEIWVTTTPAEARRRRIGAEVEALHNFYQEEEEWKSAGYVHGGNLQVMFLREHCCPVRTGLLDGERIQGLSLSMRLRAFFRLLWYGSLPAGVSERVGQWRVFRTWSDADVEFWNVEARFGFTAFLGSTFWREELEAAQGLKAVSAGEVLPKTIDELRARIKNRSLELFTAAIVRAKGEDSTIPQAAVAVLEGEFSGIYSDGKDRILEDMERWMNSTPTFSDDSKQDAIMLGLDLDKICPVADVEQNVLNRLILRVKHEASSRGRQGARGTGAQGMEHSKYASSDSARALAHEGCQHQHHPSCPLPLWSKPPSLHGQSHHPDPSLPHHAAMMGAPSPAAGDDQPTSSTITKGSFLAPSVQKMGTSVDPPSSSIDIVVWLEERLFAALVAALPLRKTCVACGGSLQVRFFFLRRTSSHPHAEGLGFVCVM